MGIWDYISSTRNFVIQNAPDLTTVVAKVDDVVRTKVIQSMQDEETRSKISRIATNFAKSAAVVACEEGVKTIPGLSLQLPTLAILMLPFLSWNYMVLSRKIWSLLIMD